MTLITESLTGIRLEQGTQPVLQLIDQIEFVLRGKKVIGTIDHGHLGSRIFKCGHPCAVNAAVITSQDDVNRRLSGLYSGDDFSVSPFRIGEVAPGGPVYFLQKFSA